MCSATVRGGVDLDLKVRANALIHHARNIEFVNVREGAHALFLDDDMIPQADCLLRLMRANVPVVSALCTTRLYPIRLAAKIYDEQTGFFCTIGAVRMNKLLVGKLGVGAACLLIDPPTREALIEYYLSARDWVDENLKTFNRLHVRAEQREAERARKEAIRRELWQTQRFCRVFDYGVLENEMDLSEDLSFSRKLIRLGIDSAIDTGTIVGHIGERCFSIWDVIEEQEVQEVQAV